MNVAASDVPVNIESVVMTSMDPPLKKPRFDEEVNRVAEIVLVLSSLRMIRGRKSPTELELELMSEAKSKLVEMCQEFTPNDIIGRDAIGSVIEDLGLNAKVKDQRLGFRAPRLTISEKLTLGKRKMEESKKHLIVSTSYSSPGHSTSANNVSMAHQWRNSEMKVSTSSANATGSHFIRDASGITQSRMERPQFKSDTHTGTSQGPTIPGGNYFGNTTSWSAQPHSSSTISFGTASDSKVPVQSSSRVTDPSFRPFMSQTPPGTYQGINGVNYGQTSSSFGNNHHAEIAKIIHKFLKPRDKQNLLWNPPSREYMSKAMTCHMCQGTINEVETVLICDACEKGYHLKCLQASNMKGAPKSEWHCSRCVQLYNGKTFPPKYGRVMRSATTAEMSSSTAEVQSPAERKVDQMEQKVVNQETGKATEDEAAMSQTVEAEDAAMNRTVDTFNESQGLVENDAACSCPSESVSHSETLDPPNVDNREDRTKDVIERSVSANWQDENPKIIAESSLQEENSASQTENSPSHPSLQSNTISNTDHAQQQNTTPNVQEAIQKNVTENPQEDKSY